MKLAVDRYHKTLMESDQGAAAARYLAARGIGAAEAAGHLLGVAADPMPEHEKRAGWLAIPYLLSDGRPVDVRFRCIEQHDCRHGKYASVSGAPPRIYNVGAIVRAGAEIHVTEGEFDCMILTKLGFNAVALPGATSWQPRWKEALAGFSRVFVWADPDKAGMEMLSTLSGQLRGVTRVRLTEDVSDTYLSGGQAAIEAAWADARNPAADR